jgi:hypothetical protein
MLFYRISSGRKIKKLENTLAARPSLIPFSKIEFPEEFSLLMAPFPDNKKFKFYP